MPSSRPRTERSSCGRWRRRARRFTSAGWTKLAESQDDRDGSAGPLAASEPSGSAEPPLPPLSQWDSRHRRAGHPTNAESLAALSECALARPPTGLGGRERNQLVVHVDASTLATDSPGAGMPTGSGSCADRRRARDLARDRAAPRLRQLGGRGGRARRHAAERRAKNRSVPPAVRRALAVRDGRCQFPGCERHRFVDAHHIVHWARGGPTSLDNLVLLCRHHHRLVHEGGYSVSLSVTVAGAFATPREPSFRPPPPRPLTRAAARGALRAADRHRRGMNLATA